MNEVEDKVKELKERLDAIEFSIKYPYGACKTLEKEIEPRFRKFLTDNTRDSYR